MGQRDGGGGPAGEQGGDGGEDQAQGGDTQVAIDRGEWGVEEGGEKAEGEEDAGGKIREVETLKAGQGSKLHLTCRHFLAFSASSNKREGHQKSRLISLLEITC